MAEQEMAAETRREEPESRPPAAPSSSTGDRRLALLCGLGALALLAIGARRAYDLDSSITVGFFVATKSPWDAFTQSFTLTNHVFFSFLDHLVYSVTGSRS